MHEKHQVERLVQEALQKAEEMNLKKVKAVNILIGEALGFDPMSINLYFETFTEGTVLEGAKLNFEWQKAELFCPTCKQNFIKEKSKIDCPKCNEQGLPTDQGKDFKIISLQ